MTRTTTSGDLNNILVIYKQRNPAVLPNLVKPWPWGRPTVSGKRRQGTTPRISAEEFLYQSWSIYYDDDDATGGPINISRCVCGVWEKSPFARPPAWPALILSVCLSI